VRLVLADRRIDGGASDVHSPGRRLSFSDLSLLTKAAATAQVTAVGILANGTLQDVTSTCTNWQSDGPSVLSVNSGGLLTAQGSGGSATITTTCQGVSAADLVAVNPQPVLPPSQPHSQLQLASQRPRQLPMGGIPGRRLLRPPRQEWG
jgi:hypothetical protein